MWKVLVLVAALLVAGCDKIPDKRICSTPGQLDVTGANVGTWDGASSCLHRWSYRLAGSSEPSSQVAEAVVGGCYDAIDKWVTKVTDYGDTPPYRDPVTGRMGDYRSKMFQEARSAALFYVVQARAGHCAIP